MLETIESPAVRRRFGGRLPRGLRFPWRGAELGAFREGEQSPVVVWRDTRFRRALATADAVALLVAFTSVLVLGGDRPAPTAGLLLALIVALGKIAGLYDRDDNLLSKSTVDELPGLFQVATVCALVVWLAEGASWTDGWSEPRSWHCGPSCFWASAWPARWRAGSC